MVLLFKNDCDILKMSKKVVNLLCSLDKILVLR
nr:MAG TPA: hypothetical protein [Caudoviricetes sp.]